MDDPGSGRSHTRTIFGLGTEAGLNPRASVFQCVAEGLRLALFLRPNLGFAIAVESSWSTLVAVMFLGIAPRFIVDLLRIGPQAKLSPSGLPGALFTVPVLILGSWALASLAGRQEKTLTLIIALASLMIPIGCIRLAIDFAVPINFERLDAKSMGAFLAWSIPGWWFTIASMVTSIRLLGVPKRRRLAAVFLAWLLISLPLAIDRDRSLWSAPDAPDDPPSASNLEQQYAVSTEEVFYLQPRLLDRELAGLKRGRRGVIDLYFVGVAGYSRQDVFMKEVRSVADLFESRFDTRGHSLILINNPATVRTLPIATATSIEMALKRVAQVMDPDEDILFLFITSHGSRDHQAWFDFWPMKLDPLDPARLKRMLDQAGIRRRVVVVSACYSGTFVDTLRDERTLVISASAADKNSFGCSNDADFTYFGKAYFDEALRRTYSFSEAFEIARPVIAERERKAKFSGSDPKMFVGGEIKAVLERFVEARKAAARREPVKTAVPDGTTASRQP